MPYTPGTSGLLGKLLYQGLPQWEATTGRTPTTGMVQGLLGADLQGAKQQAMEQNYRDRQLAMQERLLRLQEEAAHKRNKFARFGQAMQIAQLPFAALGAAGAGKTMLGGLGLLGGSTPSPAFGGGYNMGTAQLSAPTAFNLDLNKYLGSF